LTSAETCLPAKELAQDKVVMGDKVEHKRSLEHRIAMVTGATGAIGGAIAKQLASLPGHEVVLVCRDEEKARNTVQHVRTATGNENVHFELADMSRRSSILSLADRWSKPVDVLVNNAATTPRRRQETTDGIELQFATNVMGYFWMTAAFTPHLSRSPQARVVNVASNWAGGLDINDLEFKRRPYDNGLAYRQSKQANRMLTVAFAEKLKTHGISVNACHPGAVNSRLSNDLGFGGHESPDRGAETPVWLATDRVGQASTGQYFQYLHESRCRFGEDRQAVQKLYEVCLNYR